jgi:hypothetical protein
MPRKAPDGKGVIEHRMTLGNFERSFLVEQIEKNRENALYKAGVSQIGSVLGSGVLLWGIGAYLGIGIFESLRDKVSDFVNDTSSGLADFLNPAGVGNYSDAEAARVTNVFNVLDVGIVEERDMTRANAAAINGQVKLLQEGEIEYSEFMVTYYELKEEAAKLDQLKNELIYARNVVTYIRNEFNYDRGGIPEWFDANSYLDIIEACKGYPLPEGTGITPLPSDVE